MPLSDFFKRNRKDGKKTNQNHEIKVDANGTENGLTTVTNVGITEVHAGSDIAVVAVDSAQIVKSKEASTVDSLNCGTLEPQENEVNQVPSGNSETILSRNNLPENAEEKVELATEIVEQQNLKITKSHEESHSDCTLTSNNKKYNAEDILDTNAQDSSSPNEYEAENLGEQIMETVKASEHDMNHPYIDTKCSGVEENYRSEHDNANIVQESSNCSEEECIDNGKCIVSHVEVTEEVRKTVCNEKYTSEAESTRPDYSDIQTKCEEPGSDEMANIDCKDNKLPDSDYIKSEDPIGNEQNSVECNENKAISSVTDILLSEVWIQAKQEINTLINCKNEIDSSFYSEQSHNSQSVKGDVNIDENCISGNTNEVFESSDSSNFDLNLNEVTGTSKNEEVPEEQEFETTETEKIVNNEDVPHMSIQKGFSNTLNSKNDANNDIVGASCEYSTPEVPNISETTIPTSITLDTEELSPCHDKKEHKNSINLMDISSDGLEPEDTSFLEVKEVVENLINQTEKNLMDLDDTEDGNLLMNEMPCNNSKSSQDADSAYTDSEVYSDDILPNTMQKTESQNWKVGYLQVKLPTKSRKGKLKAWQKRWVVIQADEFTSDTKNCSLMLSIYHSESGNS